MVIQSLPAMTARKIVRNQARKAAPGGLDGTPARPAAPAPKVATRAAAAPLGLDRLAHKALNTLIGAGAGGGVGFLVGATAGAYLSPAAEAIASILGPGVVIGLGLGCLALGAVLGGWLGFRSMPDEQA